MIDDNADIWLEVRERWQRDLPAVIEGRDPMRRASGLEPIGDVTAPLMERLAAARKGRAA